MKHVTYQTAGTCSRQIDFDLDDNNKIHNLKFVGGCSGNLSAIAKLLEGSDAEHTASVLNGNTCGPRPTSCADQLSKAINQALNK